MRLCWFGTKTVSRDIISNSYQGAHIFKWMLKPTNHAFIWRTESIGVLLKLSNYKTLKKVYDNLKCDSRDFIHISYNLESHWLDIMYRFYFLWEFWLQTWLYLNILLEFPAFSLENSNYWIQKQILFGQQNTVTFVIRPDISTAAPDYIGSSRCSNLREFQTIMNILLWSAKIQSE